ncbi:MAG: hypothetical protein ROO76_10525 [Terriglobia bacterium]|nr:hypothetical protein [Terriglobia bacterium]
MDELFAVIGGIVLWSALLYGGYRIFKSFMRGVVTGLETPTTPTQPVAAVCSWCGTPRTTSPVCTVCGNSVKQEM